MTNALSPQRAAALQPQKIFLLVQEIVDEPNYLKLTNNVLPLHTLCVGETDKVRLIFSNEAPAKLSQMVFSGLDPNSKAMLMLISDSGIAPASVMTPTRTA